ncbi:MAG: amidophosphoribosyltransferase [Thermodesulfobacteriota bacterium]
MGGIFGATLKTDCAIDVFYGTDYHSHLGTKRGGMAVYNEERIAKSIKKIENSYFRTKLGPELPMFHGRNGIGVISDNDAQPLIIGSHLGTFGIGTVAKINNLNEIAGEGFRQRIHFSEAGGGEVNPTELVGMLINQGDSFAEGIAHAQQVIQGSCTMLLVTKDGLIAARDLRGRTPLVIGKKAGGYAVSFETTAFFNLGYDIDYYLGPGEIVRVTPEGWQQLRPPGKDMQVCSFLWIYYGYPASNYEAINVESVRYRCGRVLGKADDTPIDMVSGIPDSGIGHAIGYANARQVPYMRPYVKYTPTWPRSFMPQNQMDRDLVARMKLIPIRDLIAGKRVLFCDDSIVRGTQLKDNVQVLFDAGACEVHMRIACPTLIYPCLFLNFSTSRSTLDLAGRKAIHDLEGVEDEALIAGYVNQQSEKNRAMVGTIREKLGLTSLKYQNIADMVEAIGMPREKLCTHCWDGSSYY